MRRLPSSSVVSLERKACPQRSVTLIVRRDSLLVIESSATLPGSADAERGLEGRTPFGEHPVEKAWLAEDAMEAWEDEGGAVLPAERPLVGTVNQVAWAKQIRANVSAEFDRVVKALKSREPGQTEQHRSETRALIAILEDKRAEVMAHDQAGYFIHDWQELRDQVRRMIIQDPRYLAIKARGVAATDSTGQIRKH